MAFRNDISIDWTVSPRRIVVAAPSTELTMQDLHDTLVRHEDDLINMSHKRIVSSSGKQLLSSDGTRVGITVALLNATVGFEDRAGPDWTVCSFLGGNLVAYEADGVTPAEPVHASSYVTIKATSSSSATLQEQDALQYASYGGGVWIDVTSANSGTAYPMGNVEYPVNNVLDAVTIANEKGFRTLNIIGNVEFDTGDTIDGFKIVGQAPTLSFITVNTGASAIKTQFFECTLAGVMDGYATLRDAIVWDMSYYSGYMHRVALTDSTITLGGGNHAVLLHCYATTAGNGSPVIDMGGSGQALTLGNYNGDIKIVNKTGTEAVDLYINEGSVELDSTVVAGTITVHGGVLIDNSNGATVTHYTNITNDVASAVWDKYDTDGGVLYTAEDKEYTKMAKEMLYNKVNVSSDELIVTVYDNDKTSIRHIIDVSPDQHTRTPR